MFLPTPPEWYTRPNWVAGFSVFSVALLIIHVVAFVSPYWGLFRISSLGITTTVNYGLWLKCTSMNSGESVCIDWTSETSSGAMKATQAFTIIGVLVAMIASLLFVLIALRNMMSKPFLIATIVMFFASAAFNIAAVFSFVVTFLTSPDSDWPSWSFILYVIKTVTSGLTGGYLLLFAKKKGILFQKPRTRTEYPNPPVSTNLPSPRKIKVKAIEETPRFNDEESKMHRELIDSKII